MKKKNEKNDTYNLQNEIAKKLSGWARYEYIFSNHYYKLYKNTVIQKYGLQIWILLKG